MKTTLTDIIGICRPKQWVKNIFLFLPLFFGGRMLDIAVLGHTFLAAVAFCFVASSIYCLNDIRDVADDRRHLRKRHRPLPSGRLSEPTAWATFGVVSVAGFLLFFLFGVPLLAIAVAAGYYLLNIAYCLVFKRVVIVDVFVVALDYVLRIVIGGIVSAVVLSPWIVLLTFLLALFIVFAKRYGDMEICDDAARSQKPVVYNGVFLMVMMGITASVTIVSYIMYTISTGTPFLYATSLFVFFGLARYLYLSLVMHECSSPTAVVFRDRPLQACLLLWWLSYVVILYVS